MQFEWDDTKNQENQQKHGIAFEDIESVFSGPMLVSIDDRFEYGEVRWIGVGFLADIVVVIVWAEKAVDVIRIISARKANRQERERYEQFLKV